MREIYIETKKILLEPIGKNTAPAITLAALKAIEFDEDPILLILSSDHIIMDKKEFIKVIKNGASYASKERLVNFGIIPTYPETGYGYIKSKTPLIKNSNEASDIESFIEKPDILTAQKLL